MNVNEEVVLLEDGTDNGDRMRAQITMDVGAEERIM